MTTADAVAPTQEVKHPSGVEIRFFAEDKEAKVKRHYEVRDMSGATPYAWAELPSVTTVIDSVLKKEALISWAQRVGAGGVVKLCNMKVLKPGLTPGGHEVLCLYDAARGGLVVADEWEAVELLKLNRLTTNDAKEAGGERGQSVHDAFENWMHTGVLPDPSIYPISEQGYVSALQAFLLDAICEPRASEVVVAHPEDGWAGRYDGDLWLPAGRDLWSHLTEKGRGDQQTHFPRGLYRVDLKTAKGPFPEHGEQLEAYERGALVCGLEPSVQRCMIHCAENGRYRFVPVGSGTPKIKQYAWATYDDFLATLAKYQAMQARKERRDGG